MTSPSKPPHDLEAERCVIGAILTAPHCLVMAMEEGLRASHFYRERHATIYEVMLEMFDDQISIDTLTIVDRLRSTQRLEKIGGQATIYALCGAVPSVAHIREYSRIVRQKALWRRRQSACAKMLEAVNSEDQRVFDLAEEQLQLPEVSRSRTYDPVGLAEMLRKYFTEDKPAATRTGFRTLDAALGGGLHPGQVTLIGGWTSHGKSVLLDQLLEQSIRQNQPTHLYLNEMTSLQRVSRTVTRETEIPVLKVMSGDLPGAQQVEAVEAIKRIGFGMTDAAGWTAEEIMRDAKISGHKVVGIDILHLIEHEEERDLARISRAINQGAKKAGLHAIATVHFNEKRVHAAARPFPTLGDIRGSGMLKNDADNVVLVYRKDDLETGKPTEEGTIQIAKARHGEVTGFKVSFNPTRMRFELPFAGGIG